MVAQLGLRLGLIVTIRGPGSPSAYSDAALFVLQYEDIVLKTQHDLMVDSQHCCQNRKHSFTYYDMLKIVSVHAWTASQCADVFGAGAVDRMAFEDMT